MAGSLFIRTLDRSERIYMAMLARGYDGEIRQRVTAPLGKLRRESNGPFGFTVRDYRDRREVPPVTLTAVRKDVLTALRD